MRKKQKPLKVKAAIYNKGRSLTITFNNKQEQVIDFTEAFNSLYGYYAKFNTDEAFQKFRVERGNIHWGQMDDINFPISELYYGTVKPFVQPTTSSVKELLKTLKAAKSSTKSAVKSSRPNVVSSVKKNP